MPGDGELTDLQLRDLEALNRRSQYYDESLKIDDLELDVFREHTRTGRGHFDSVADSRMKIRDMMMYDTEYAEKLEEVYPDIYKEAQDEHENLERQANLSGMEKIKQDTFAIKKSAAKKKLKKIEAARGQIEKRAYEKAGAKAGKLLNEKRATVKKQIEESNDPDEIAVLKNTLGILDNTKNDTPIERMDALFNTSDYVQGMSAKVDEFLRKKPVRCEDGTFTGYNASSYFRDTARFTAGFQSADKADMKEMLLVADATYVLLYGSHADAEYETVEELEEIKEEEKTEEKKNEEEKNEEEKKYRVKYVKRQVKATELEQKIAYEFLESKVNECIEDIKSALKLHPELLREGPNLEDILADFTFVNELYKKLQVTNYTLQAMRDSDIMKDEKFKNEKLEAYKKARTYTGAVQGFAMTLFAQARTYSLAIEGKGDMPKPLGEKQTLSYIIKHQAEKVK